MDLQQVVQRAKHLDAIDPANFQPTLQSIQQFYDAHVDDVQSLGTAIRTLARSIMEMKDVSPALCPHLETIIQNIILMSIKHQFSIGFDALRLIFDSSSTFYKSAHLDPNLECPIGADRPLQNYTPAIGQTCDIIRPYITSTSFCGWTRCEVVSEQNGKYTLHYQNTQNSTNVRDKPFFAPVGQRTTENEWRFNLDIGSEIDALRSRVWYKSIIAELRVNENGIKQVRVAFRRYHEEGDRVDSDGNKYSGLGAEEDQVMDIYSFRIQKPGTLSNKKLCYYTYTCDEALPDDTYEILFLKEYKEKPFHGIMRSIWTRSLSYIGFMNTFVENKGLQTLLKRMDNPNLPSDATFQILLSIGNMSPFIPRMDLYRYQHLYERVFQLFRDDFKNLTQQKINMAYHCFDNIGRRLFSLAEVYNHQRQLRKFLILEFLQLNMEKQMLALRYLYDIINQYKKPLLDVEREEVDLWLKEKQIFGKLYQNNLHEEILLRSINFFKYLIQRKIVGWKEVQVFWNSVPITDQRGRSIIEKVLAEVSKEFPIQHVEELVNRLLTLKETELTVDNLNLLRTLKNREVSSEVQEKILSYLWVTVTQRAGNLKENIEEEVRKVFKVFIAGLRNPSIRAQVLDAMMNQLQNARLTNQLDLLRDFILSYYEKKPEGKIEEESDAPVTIPEAVKYVKSRNIYEKVLKLFMDAKENGVIQQYLTFLGFLFSHDSDDINQILKAIYEKLGPSEIFLKWIHKIFQRASQFMIQIFNSTQDFTPFENLTSDGFQTLEDIILDINQKEKNIRIQRSRKSQNAGTSTSQIIPPPPLSGPYMPPPPPFIGPHMPEEVKHMFVLVSPEKIKGTVFLEKLLPFLKNTKVYDEVIKLLIKFVVHLDDSIEDHTEEYRKSFLNEIMKAILKILEANTCDDKIKTSLQAYIHLIHEIFVQTERNGMGDLQPHFQQVEGEVYSIKFENCYDKNKSEKSFDLKINENMTVWKLKRTIGEIIGQETQTIDITKFVEAFKDFLNSKCIGDFYFSDGDSMKITKKPQKQVLKYDLFTDNGQALSPRFLDIIEKWFMNFREGQDAFTIQSFKKLSDTHWKGSLFKEPERHAQILKEFDEGNKGYLTLNEFKNFFYIKATKNSNAIWKIINLSGYLNNLKHKQDQKVVTKIAELPRRILSTPFVHNVIFKALQNPTFEPVHSHFYRLLTCLEVDKQSRDEIKANGKNIICNSTCLYRIGYTLEVLNSQLSKKDGFFYDFFEANGLEAIKEKFERIISEKPSIYEQDSQIKGTILPNIVKILNMYLIPLYCDIPSVRFLSRFRINFMDVEDVVKKKKEDKEPQNYFKELKDVSNKLRAINIQLKCQEWYKNINTLLHNMIKNYGQKSSEFLPKLTSEIVRCIATLILGNELFNPVELIYGVKNESLNFRRGTSNITYIYLENNESYAEEVISEMLKQMPTESKTIYSNYFSLLSEIVSDYSHKAPQEKDQFLIDLTNSLLDKLFNTLPPEKRTSLLSDKVIMGILMTVEMVLYRRSVCQALAHRKHQIVSKCLFFYNAREKMQSMEIKDEHLQEQKQTQLFNNYVICKTEDPRKHAYKIVQLLHEVSRETDPNFLEEFVLPVIKDLPGEARKTDTKCLFVGLNNLGSTCYMNAMLQVLNFVRPFRNLLMEVNSQSPLVEELKQLFSYLFYSERIDYAPKKLLKAFVPPIEPGVQEDTTEFLNCLFDQLEKALSPTAHKHLLDQVFKGANAAQMICHSCGAKRQNREEFFCYSVEINNKYDLESALNGAHEGQVISDFFCQSCNNRGETTKRNILCDIPSVFFVHLRRIVFNYDMFMNMKIHTRLQFPQQLNIQPYTKEGVELRESLGVEYMKNLRHNEEERKKFEQMTLHGKEKDYYKMLLKGVIVHSGSANVGHYYTIVPNTTTTGWVKLDDSRTTVFASSNFQSECFGGSWTNEEWGGFGSSTNAYVLVYEKVQKNPIRILSEEMSENTETKCLNYDQVKIYNTIQRYKQVWLDNHQFLVECHLLESYHAKRFMNFVCEVLSHSKTENQIITICEILYKISMFSGQVGDLGKLFDQFSSQITPKILQQYILKDKKKTFQLLFHQQKPVRDLASSIIHGVLISNYKNEGEQIKKSVLDYIKELLAGLSSEVAKNWLRIDGYFKLFFRLLASSVEIPELYNIFLSFNLIATLIDFIMEKSSPVRINAKNHSVGTKTHPADFQFGIQIISFLLRRSYGFNGINYEVPALPEEYLFHLSENDVTCLSCLAFYEKMIAENQNMQTLSTIIQRLCIQNLKFSKAIIRAVLSAVTSITDFKDQMKKISTVIQSILVIKDNLWRARAEALLGVSSPYILEDNTIATLDEERFVFASTLYDIFPVECLFTYVYIYRLKNPLGCFQLIKAIVRGCSVSPQSMYYLAKQPSSSYYYFNYIDWLCDFVPSFINFVTIDDKRKKQIEAEISEVGNYLKDISEYLVNNSFHDYYNSLITGALCGKRVVQIITNEEENVEIILSEYEVHCVQSQPTKHGNKTLDDLLDGGKITKKLHEKSSLLQIMKKPKKALALKMQPVEEDEDKELVSLFDPDPNPSNNKVTDDPNVSEKEKGEKKKEEQKQEKEKEPEKMEEEHKQEKKEENMDIEDEGQLVELDGLFKCDYYRQLEIVNKSKTAKFVKITFQNQPNSNVNFPISLSFKVGFKNNEKVWFSKQVYNQPWPDFKITTKVQDFSKDKKSHQWYKTYGEQQVKPEEKRVVIDQPEEKPEQKSNQENNPPPQLPEMMEVECPVCTFKNLPGLYLCEVCESPLN